MIWEPTSTASWANVLGLVHVPLFGGNRAPACGGTHAVLLDGQRASFAVSAVDSADVRFDEEPLSWSWSANVRHLLTIDRTREQMFLRRWDSPGQMRVFRLPKHGRGAQDLLTILEGSPAPKAADVILFLLRAFREVRSFFPSPEHSIAVLNVLLMGTEAVRLGNIRASDWTRCRTLEDSFQFFEPLQLADAGVDEHLSGVRKSTLRGLQDFLLQREPVTGCLLEPDLLLRHASSQLYQEAHLELERDLQMSLFAGYASEVPQGRLDRDVRYTPANLARALVQQALKARQNKNAPLHILDPACGSGVFLLEILRELAASSFAGDVTIGGFDKTHISCTIAKFCLHRAKHELETPTFRIKIEIRQQDALTTSWAKPDIVVMNPPFVAWDRMGSEDQEHVREILQHRGKGRMDKAMAFLWKAVTEVEDENGVVATVLPAPLLENQSGADLRDAIREVADLHTIGRFEGTGFFASSMVETAFVVLRRHGRPKGARSKQPEVQVILAKENYEGAALRALRINKETGEDFEQQGYEVFSAKADFFADESWSPRSGSVVRLIAGLRDAKLPTVGELFEVRQGAITGLNDVFILTAEVYLSLPKKEQAFFRPLAGNSTIKDGHLEPLEYVFFPYKESGLAITTEDALATKVKRYYEQYLRPHRRKLMERARVEDQWWRLSEHRSWQRQREPKLISTYFGDRGSFAYDNEGEYVVGQGYGWLWKRQDPIVANDDASVTFHESRLPLAYLAVLNSPIFEKVLECFCPRVQGGQFNLSKRFVDRVFLPDLTDEGKYRNSLVSALARLGSEIHKGRFVDEKALTELSVTAYKVSVRI